MLKVKVWTARRGIGTTPPDADAEVLSLWVAILVGVVSAGLLVTTPFWAVPTFAFIWSNWVWFLIVPLILLLIWFAWDLTYSWPFPLAIGSAAAALLVQLAGIVEVFDLLTKSVAPSIPVWLLVSGLVFGVLAAAGARRVDRYDWEGVWFAAAALTGSGIAGVVVWQLAARWVGMEDLLAVGNWALRHSIPIAFAVSVAALFFRLRVSAGAQFVYDLRLEGNYGDPNIESYADLARAMEASAAPDREGRGRWIRRLAALARRSGIGFLDVSLMLITAICFALTVLYYIPDQLVGTEGLSPAEVAAARTDERRTALAMLAAVGAGLTLVYTHLRHQLDRRANSTERFTDGVRQLATEELSTRLGGLYILGQVARESPSDANNIIQIISAYARESTEVRGEQPEATPLTPVSIAALKVLADSPTGATSPDLRGINLSYATLEDLECRPGTGFQDADFRASIVNRGRLRSASFERAKLQSCSMEKADLSGSDFSNAEMSDAAFINSNLRGASFVGTRFGSIVLRDVEMTSARFIDVRLTDASLRNVDLRGAIFRQVDLCGVNLTSCQLDYDGFVGPVLYDDSTRWPRRFKLRRVRRALVRADADPPLG